MSVDKNSKKNHSANKNLEQRIDELIERKLKEIETKKLELRFQSRY